MGTKAEPIRVLIADDQPVALLGIREILEREPNISVVAEARSGTEVLHCLINLDVDILVLEVKLSGPQGVEVIRQLAQRVPLVPVLILSAYDEDELIQKMLDSGVSGYLLKQEAPKHIVEAIHGVARGETGWFSSKVVRKMLSLKDRESMLRRLEVTEREWEVLALLAKGYNNERMSKMLYKSIGTIKNQLTSIYEKLGVESRSEAITWIYINRLEHILNLRVIEGPELVQKG